jgi:uncharacterized phage protein (TIGR02220 family)
MKPDYKGAWIALYRKTVNSDSLLSLSCAERSVFLQSFFLAAGTEYDFLYHGRTYHLLPGQFVITLDDFAKRCGHGCSVKIVRRTLDKLRVRLTWADGRVSQRADAPHLVTFTNWSSYQLGNGMRADERADTRVPLGQEECQQSLSGIDGFSSKNEGITYDTQTRIEDTPIVPKLGKRKKPELTPEESEVLSYLNLKADNSFTASGEIGKRLGEGHTVEECKIIIDKKVAEWLGTTFDKNLNPTTLFRLCHFDTYLHQKGEVPMKKFNLNEIGKSNVGEW